MKIGITQIILGNTSIDDVLSLCQDAGYECIELCFRPNGPLDAEMSDDEIKAVGQKFADIGVEVASVIAGYADQGNLLSPSAEEREKRMKSLERSLEIAGLLGVNGTLLHPGQLAADGTYESVWDNMVSAMKEIAPAAQKYGCKVGVENVWNKFILSPREAREFVDQVGSEWVGIYLDTANMMAYGYPEQWVRSLGARICKVHFKDFSRGEHKFVHLMDGDTDWATLMKELRAAGYDDSVIHEVGGDREVQIEMARRMREILAL